MTILRNFWRDDQGQDLIEYTLLLAFICLAAAAIFIGTGLQLKNIWLITNGTVSNAAVAAS